MPLSEVSPDGHDADDVPCGFLSLLPDGRIAYANRRVAEWIGYATGDLAGKRFHDLLSVPARIFYETNISPLLRMQGFVDEVAMDLVAHDGSRVQTLVNAAERRDAAGGLVRTDLAIFKATERRRYERALIAAKDATDRAVLAEQEASQLREQFIAVLGHDLRNPAAAVKFGFQVSVSVSPDRQKETEIAIGDAVDCDRVRLGQLLSNLLGNAVTHGSKADPIIVRAATLDGMLEISVANGGRPIDEATRQKLFQPFFRGELRPNQVGLGLGLHIASEIAKAHDGTLEVTSDERETRFTFSMPLVPQPEN